MSKNKNKTEIRDEIIKLQFQGCMCDNHSTNVTSIQIEKKIKEYEKNGGDWMDILQTMSKDNYKKINSGSLGYPSI